MIFKWITRRLGLYCLLLLALSVLQACSDSSPKDSFASTAVNSDSSFGEPDLSLTYDDKMRSVTNIMPQFAGFHLDENGKLVISLADSGLLPKPVTSVVVSAVTTVFGLNFFDRDGLMESVIDLDVSVKDVQYNFSELSVWYDKFASNITELGITVIDIDEYHNKISLRVSDEAAANRIEQALPSLAVPSEAVNIEIKEAFKSLYSLTGYHRAVTGGTLINGRNNSTGLKNSCTLGYSVRYYVNGVGALGFLTNSHCTRPQGGVADYSFYQYDLTNSGHFIGKEFRDPNYIVGGICPSGKRCRNADIALGDYSDGAFKAATVANITTANTDFTFTDTKPVRDNGQDPIRAEYVNKVGTASGLSQGTVTGTCVGAADSNTDTYFVCQAVVEARDGQIAAKRGDSGSPVFVSTSTGYTPRGIMWGGSSEQFVFSSISQIEKDLGPIDFKF